MHMVNTNSNISCSRWELSSDREKKTRVFIHVHISKAWEVDCTRPGYKKFFLVSRDSSRRVSFIEGWLLYFVSFGKSNNNNNTQQTHFFVCFETYKIKYKKIYSIEVSANSHLWWSFEMSVILSCGALLYVSHSPESLVKKISITIISQWQNIS